MWADLALVLAANAGVCLVAVTLVWLLSIALNDVSIIDIYWGPGFAVVAWATFVLVAGVESRQVLVAALVTIWAGRLGLYLGIRKRGEGEDPRYTKFIDHLTPDGAPAFRRHLVSLRRIYLMQGAIMWVVALPVMVAMTIAEPAALGPMAFIGAGLWAVGFAFETVGDWQMSLFKADPGNAGKVMDRGLWRYTRHPNYFGDSCVWFGFFLIACEHWIGVLTIVSPVLMTYLLVRVTGAALLERRLRRARPDYEAYVRRTSGFIPLPPRKV